MSIWSPRRSTSEAGPVWKSSHRCSCLLRQSRDAVGVVLRIVRVVDQHPHRRTAEVECRAPVSTDLRRCLLDLEAAAGDVVDPRFQIYRQLGMTRRLREPEPIRVGTGLQVDRRDLRVVALDLARRRIREVSRRALAGAGIADGPLVPRAAGDSTDERRGSRCRLNGGSTDGGEQLRFDAFLPGAVERSRIDLDGACGGARSAGSVDSRAGSHRPSGAPDESQAGLAWMSALILIARPRDVACVAGGLVQGEQRKRQ
jgi:hypothetical protein